MASVKKLAAAPNVSRQLLPPVALFMIFREWHNRDVDQPWRPEQAVHSCPSRLAVPYLLTVHASLAVLFRYATFTPVWWPVCAGIGSHHCPDSGKSLTDCSQLYQYTHTEQQDDTLCCTRHSLKLVTLPAQRISLRPNDTSHASARFTWLSQNVLLNDFKSDTRNNWAPW